MAQLGVGLREHGAGFGQALADLLQLAKLHDRDFEFAQGAAGFLVLLVVGDDLGKAELCGELLVPLFHMFQTIDHG